MLFNFLNIIIVLFLIYFFYYDKDYKETFNTYIEEKLDDVFDNNIKNIKKKKKPIFNILIDSNKLNIINKHITGFGSFISQNVYSIN